VLGMITFFAAFAVIFPRLGSASRTGDKELFGGARGPNGPWRRAARQSNPGLDHGLK
jgi:hypothetical protein